MSNLYTVFEGFTIDKPTLFDGLAIYPLVNGENTLSVPYITISFKNEDERKALLVKIKSLWYAVCFLSYLEKGEISNSIKLTTWYDSDVSPTVACGDAPPILGGYLSRLREAEGGGRLHKAAKSLSWLVLYLTETDTEQRAIKLYNGFGALYEDYSHVPTQLAHYVEAIKRIMEAEEPEPLLPLTNSMTEDIFNELEKLFIKDFLKQYGKLFSL